MSVFVNYGITVNLGIGSFKSTFNSKTESVYEALSADNVTHCKILFYFRKHFRILMDGVSVVLPNVNKEDVADKYSGRNGNTRGDGGTDFE